MRSAILLVAFAAFACDKPSPPPEPSITPAREPAASAALSAEPTTAPSSAVAAPSAIVPAPSASIAALPATHATATHAAPRASAAPTAAPEPAPAPALKAASKHVTGKNFALDVASAGCRVATDCTLTITMNATGEFHVNKEYPYKFTAAANPGVTFLGKSDALTFSRATGDFAEQGEKTATMTVRLKPSRAGDVAVSGTYKLSVCSADQCQIEQQAIDLVVPVL